MKAELYQEFKDLLEDLKTQLTKNISQLSSEMKLIANDSEIDDDADASLHMTDTMDHVALMKQQRDELADVDRALSKFSLGSYGVCEKTGDTIPLERLRVEPQARCIVGVE